MTGRKMTAQKKPDAATLAQNDASEPLASTWLSANAGSGKTKVLTDRVARLLLAGVAPQNILCLTYTKAAASEMQNRLFKLLGTWAMKPEADLRADLAGLGEAPVDDLGPIRSLFARAIETPGGLKIQTIHSFCAALLRRFPLEAGVSPQFQEMDDRSAMILREEVVEEMALGPDRGVLADLARFYTGHDFDKVTRAISENRRHFASAPDPAQIWRWCGLAPGMDAPDIVAGAMTPQDTALITALVPILHASASKTEQRLATKLSGFGADMDPADRLEMLQAALLTRKGTPVKNPLTKAVCEGPAAGMIGPLRALQERLALALDQQHALLTAQKTLAMYRFAGPFLARLDAHKRNRGWLDFDDLIEKTAALLSDPEMAGWVLFRLDGQIDHILVDEAQDTSPAQWRVIASLAQEFTAGAGARDAERTIFVVGDPKQSIYSFQGADPAAFSDMKQHFRAGFGAIGKPMQDLRLEYSFRSSPAVLDLVDHALDGMQGLGDAGFRHQAFFADKPGRVDLWPVVEKADYREDRAWYDTTDRALPETHTRRLARQVAAEIGRMLREETLPGADGAPRPVQPGDVLILVRGRKTGLFEALIRACKAAGLPVAGADRLKLGAEMAVRDLTALLKFLATQEDDLSLAAVLRSPLCGLSEAQLYALAQPRARGAYLWNELRRHPGHGEVVAMLDDLRKAADFKRPFELLERVLTRHRGREYLLARLGREAAEGIDALLAQALEYERAETPSLTGFLEWLEVMEIEVKRQMDAAGNLIRVMTVHGAKGLEAPIVFLPDCGPKAARDNAEFLELEEGVIWRPIKGDLPEGLLARADAAMAVRQAEDDRLLYVAATRAAHWLIIAAAGDLGRRGDSWYEMLKRGMERLGAAEHTFAAGPGLRHEIGDWPVQTGASGGAVASVPALPGWVLEPVPAPQRRPEPLSPSDLGGAKALPGEGDGAGEDAAMRRGRLLHLLLEKLPDLKPSEWESHGMRLLTTGADAMDVDQARDLLGEAAALIRNPALAAVFGPDSLAEVDVSAALPALSGERIQGAIDRLIIGTHSVTVVDFKSNRQVPDHAQEIPIGLLRQMGAYMAAVAQIYPGFAVRGAILWTSTGTLMDVPFDLAARALCLDDAGPAT